MEAHRMQSDADWLLSIPSTMSTPSMRSIITEAKARMNQDTENRQGCPHKAGCILLECTGKSCDLRTLLEAADEL